MAGSKLTSSVRWRNFRIKIDNEKISQKSVNQNLLEYIGLLSAQIEQLTKVVNEQAVVISQINTGCSNLTNCVDQGFKAITGFINEQIMPRITDAPYNLGDVDTGKKKPVTRQELKEYLDNEAFDDIDDRK